MSVLGPSVIKQHLQYLSDEDDDAADAAPEPIKVGYILNVLHYICVYKYVR